MAPTREGFKGGLCSFPVAAVTNYHKLSGLEQQKFILSQCWKPEVQNQFQ